MQALPNGDVFLGWGQQPYVSEDTASGQQDFDAHFNVPTSSYRAYRFAWSAQPPTSPAIADSPAGNGQVNLYASWNGATDVAAWRVLGGPNPNALAAIGGSGKRGFETAIGVHSDEPYFAVQAVGGSGQTLAASRPVATSPHIAVYGASAYVPSSGFGGVPAGCFTPHPCHVATTITVGRTVIAHTGSEYIARGGTGVLYFRLTDQGRALLQRARYRRLPVQVSARDSKGATATTRLSLIPFYTSGRGPRRSLSETHTVQVIGATDYILAGRNGAILARCASFTPCHIATTLSVGRTVIARTGPEFLGANELGYLSFSPTARGRALLARSTAHGNQLGAHLTLTASGATASGNIALVQYR